MTRLVYLLFVLSSAVGWAAISRSPKPEMHMLLKKTFLGVKVLTVDVWFDPTTDHQLRDLASHAGENKLAEGKIAQLAIDAPSSTVRVRFLRDVGFSRFISETESAVKCARDAGIIDGQELARVQDGLPKWYAPLKDRGMKKGDEIIYTVGPDSLRTRVQSADARTLVDAPASGPTARRTVLGSYFAPCSEFREDLIGSLKKLLAPFG